MDLAPSPATGQPPELEPAQLLLPWDLRLTPEQFGVPGQRPSPSRSLGPGGFIHPIPITARSARSRAAWVSGSACEPPPPAALPHLGALVRIQPCLKDLLTYEGIDALLPREVLRQAYAYGLLLEGQRWIDMLEQRNLMAHTDEATRAQQALALIQERFAPALRTLAADLGQRP